MIGIVARRTTTSQQPQCLCLHLTTAASSYSRHRHRHGSSYRDRHRCSAYNYVTAATVSLPASDYGCLELQSPSPSPSAWLFTVRPSRSSLRSRQTSTYSPIYYALRLRSIGTDCILSVTETDLDGLTDMCSTACGQSASTASTLRSRQT